MVVFLHGAGERENNLNVVRQVGLPHEIDNGLDASFVMLMPQCRNNKTWFDYAETIKKLIHKYVNKKYIDYSKVYITGLSMGGFDFNARMLKDMPVRAYHGKLDSAVPVEYTIRMVKKINEAGGNAQAILYDDVDHDRWIKAYFDPELYKWLFAQKKKS